MKWTAEKEVINLFDMASWPSELLTFSSVIGDIYYFVSGTLAKDQSLLFRLVRIDALIKCAGGGKF